MCGSGDGFHLYIFQHLSHLLLDRWTVNATMNPVYCTAIVDFNVPGRWKPPPVNLTATVWIQSRSLHTGSLEKYAIEWTDPSGTLAPPKVPLNTWVQIEKYVSKVNREIDGNSCIEGSPLIFKDQHDGDSKQVKLFENRLSIAPFGSNDRLVNSLCAISDSEFLFSARRFCFYSVLV